MVLCHFDAVLSSDGDYPINRGGERRAFLIDGYFTFNLFEGQL